MKSRQLENKIRTNCKECVFAVYEDKTQVSCDFDRIKNFGENVFEGYDDDKEFYIIDRLCTYYRDHAWGYSKNDKDIVEKESAASFDIVFDCNEFDNDKKNDIIKLINDIDYYKEKISLFAICNLNNKDSIQNYITDIMNSINKKITISIYENEEEFLHKTILSSKRTFHTIIKSLNNIQLNSIIKKINLQLNTKLDRFLVAKCDNVTFISNYAYKSLNNFEPTKLFNFNIEEIIHNSKSNFMYAEI